MKQNLDITAERDKAAIERDNAATERDKAATERDNVATERDNAATERDNAATERNNAATERNNVATERNNAATERDNVATDDVATERDNAATERDNVATERDNVATKRDNVATERDNVATERDNVATKRDNVAAKRGNIQAERDNIVAERDNIAAKRDNIVAERDNIVAKRDNAAEKLEYDYQYVRSLFKASLDLLVTISLEGKITDANTPTEQVTGIPKDQLIGSDFANYFTNKQNALDCYKQALEKGCVIDYSLAILHTSGRITDVIYNASLYRDTNGEVQGIFASARDVTERVKAENEIKQLAYYDSLTGLPNRRKLLDRLNYSIQLSHREGKKFAVFMMDLDKFKAVNDAFGHAAGDDLLKQVANKITKRLRDSDMVARLGGDEFVIVLENYHHHKDVEKVATELIADLMVEFELAEGKNVQIGASIGISFYPEHGITPEKLMNNADIALYQAKDNGRGCFAYCK
jgi:diguanylate cyclase (GGDEF)-like protein/PAS domain S-box-containing protein